MTDPQPPPADLERLREIFTQIAYVRLLGIEFVGAGPGSATFALEVRPELMRQGGLMHGGALASLIDTAAAFAVMTLLPAGRHTVTVDLTLHFLRPALQGRVEATARVLRSGRRVATVSVEAADPSGKLISTATTTYLIMEGP